MDNVMSKLNDLESKIEKYRPKTPEEKLELRSLDSGPYNQKLTDFFTDKQQDMQKSGKNEYILTTDEVEDYSVDEIKGTFNNYGEEGDIKQIKN
jgi:type II restriction/modification system DNA methylase subunit YeeA